MSLEFMFFGSGIMTGAFLAGRFKIKYLTLVILGACLSIGGIFL